MKVSVVVPAFNAERFLKGCLASVVRQNCHYPVEIVVVNDGSTDATRQIAVQHAHKVASHNVNKGIGATRRECSEIAVGDHVAFLSSDDAYHHHFLELMMPEADGKHILFCNYFVCDSQLVPQRVFLAPKANSQDHFRTLVLEWALRQNMFVNFSTVVIPKYVFDQVQFHEDLRYGEDLIFLLETVKAGIPWQHVELPLVYYRLHKDAGSVKGWNPRLRRALWSRLVPLLLKLDVSESQVCCAEKRAMALEQRVQRKRKVPTPIIQVYRKLRTLI